jgi:hypothetical protein
LTKLTIDAVTDSTPGWTLAEAIERASVPDDSTEKASELSQQKIALWERLSIGELVATGSFDTPAASPVAIDPQKFPTLEWHGSPSTLVGVAGSDVQVFNVRVFPILRAPNAASYLNGLSLAEAFRRYVIEDPEVSALAKCVLKIGASHSPVFLEGQAPGPFVDFHWSLDATSSAIAFRFVASPLVIIGDPLPTPSEAISAVSEVLADRIGALRDVLAGGKVVAFGTAMQTGIEGPIGRLQWIRSGISIDVSRGDLCDGQDHRAVPKWTGLSLRLPDASLSPNQSQNGPPLKIVEVPRKAKAQIPTKEKCRVDCVAWLETMMSNPEIVPRSIDDLWAEAQLKWPNKLSKRAFLKARDDAIANKQAWAWKAPGPKPKSPHS